MFNQPHSHTPTEPAATPSRCRDNISHCHENAIKSGINLLEASSRHGFDTCDGGLINASADSSAVYCDTASCLDGIQGYRQRYVYAHAVAPEIARNGDEDRGVAVLGSAGPGVADTNYLGIDPYAEGARARRAGLTGDCPYLLWPCVAAQWLAGFEGAQS